MERRIFQSCHRRIVFNGCRLVVESIELLSTAQHDRIGYHGMPIDVLPKILEKGLTPSTHGHIGPGVYIASNPAQAVDYTLKWSFEGDERNFTILAVSYPEPHPVEVFSTPPPGFDAYRTTYRVRSRLSREDDDHEISVPDGSNVQIIANVSWTFDSTVLPRYELTKSYLTPLTFGATLIVISTPSSTNSLMIRDRKCSRI